MKNDRDQEAISSYSILDHTADLGVEIYGTDERELFCNAAFVLFDIMIDIQPVHPVTEKKIFVEGRDMEELLVNFLRELLYLFTGEGFLLRECVIVDMDDFHLNGIVKGEPFDRGRHHINTEIKAVTYHRVEIRKTEGGLAGRIVFDV